MIKFTKMQGLGNDYVYIDAINQDIEKESELALFVSDRHYGIGSDGLILICRSKIADFKMKMFNPDGSEAEMCGNGIRCVGKFVYDNGLTQKTLITIETLAGIKKLKLNLENGEVKNVKVDMGEPILEAEKIPVCSDEKIIKNFKINVEDMEFNITAVSMGNPHAVVFIKNIEKFNVEKYGKQIENNISFPKRTNVEFVEIINKEKVKMRVWERGTGETLACGTGACATVVAGVLNNFIERKANVELLGGILEIEWNKEDNRIYMTGEAKTVFEGELYKE